MFSHTYQGSRNAILTKHSHHVSKEMICNGVDVFHKGEKGEKCCEHCQHQSDVDLTVPCCWFVTRMPRCTCGSPSRGACLTGQGQAT